MRYFFAFLFFALLLHPAQAQNSLLWKGYFSYNTVKDLAQSPTKFLAASENAVFTKNLSTNEIKTINTIDGLSSEIISAIYYSDATQKTFIGYENGLLIVINNDGSILNVVDIISKQISPNIKKINHFMEHEGILYLSCDFGITQYNLATLQFGDTYFIGSGSGEIRVSQTAFLNGFIYAATATEGLKKADLANPDLIDASQWTQVLPGNFTSVETFQDNLFAVAANGSAYRSNNGVAFSGFGPALSPSAVDLRASGTNLLLTTPTVVYVYNEQFALSAQVNASQITEASVAFTCATAISGTLYIGTTERGVITTSLSNTMAFQFISPSGPLRNNIFSINAQSPNLWAVFGAYDQVYTPQVKSYGISKYTAEAGWKNIPFSEVDGAHDLVRVTVNPTNENEIYVSSYSDGLLKFENDVLTKHYTYTNSGLESLADPSFPDYKNVRIEQSAYDKAGNLWMSNGLVKNAIKVLTASGQWQSFSIDGVVDNFFASRFGRLSIDKNGTKWFSTISDGVVGFNENGNIFKRITEGADAGNLPVSAVQVTAVDLRNQIWVGTRQGLRVFSGDSFLSDQQQIKANPIIILEDGLAQELLFNQFITDIVVDGANNKWVGTADAGVFLFSANGQETKHHFTSANSPLPSNAINDIDINATTGEVFFATANGMVSYKGNSVGASEDLKNVVVYPNPVRPNFEGTVKITGLLDKADVKIADIEGNLVYEAISSGGTMEWDTRAFGKYKVASGVYMIFIAAQDGGETTIKKVMIIR